MYRRAMEQEVRLTAAWRSLLSHEFSKPYFAELTSRIRDEYLSARVYPHPTRLFRALDLVQPGEVRVVILGQDPYHTPGVADGLAFSSMPGSRVPPSLQNIFKEIEAELGIVCKKDPHLERWAEQGVLLLNASLSVRENMANSHAEYGWHYFTDAIISALSEKEHHIVFMLWGAFARKKSALIDASKHLVLESAHPSPLSAHNGFFGNNHFKLANEYLTTYGRTPINWS